MVLKVSEDLYIDMDSVSFVCDHPNDNMIQMIVGGTALSLGYDKIDAEKFMNVYRHKIRDFVYDMDNKRIRGGK